MDPTNQADCSLIRNVDVARIEYYQSMYHEEQVYCPYCGEAFTCFVDLSQGDHQTIEDCYVCCRPIEFRIESDGQSLLRIDVATDDE